MCHPILFSSKYLLLLPRHYYEFSCLILKHLEMSTFFIIDFYLNYVAWEDITAFYFSPMKFVEILLCPKDDTNFWKCWKHADWNACSVLVGAIATVLMICLYWTGIIGTNAQFFQTSLFFLPVRSISKKCELNFLSMIMIFSFSLFCFSRSNFYVV